MSVRDVLRIPASLSDPKFSLKMIKMLSSFVLELTKMFTGPFGAAYGPKNKLG